MHSEEIKALIRKEGTTLAGLSKKWGYSPSAISVALNRPWREVEVKLAEFLHLPVEELWPERYGTNRGQTKSQVANPNASSPWPALKPLADMALASLGEVSPDESAAAVAFLRSTGFNWAPEDLEQLPERQAILISAYDVKIRANVARVQARTPDLKGMRQTLGR